MPSFKIKIEKIETAPTGESVPVIPGAAGGWTYARKLEGVWWENWTDAQITPEFWARAMPTLQTIKDAFL
jgi:hypothetical protein